MLLLSSLLPLLASLSLSSLLLDGGAAIAGLGLTCCCCRS
jgi:hypothetical protein